MCRPRLDPEQAANKGKHPLLGAVCLLTMGVLIRVRPRPVSQAADNFLTLSSPRRCSARHRSYCACWCIHLSADVSKAVESRIAISGRMPVRPFNRLDKVLRLTPRALAASVSLRGAGDCASASLHLSGNPHSPQPRRLHHESQRSHASCRSPGWMLRVATPNDGGGTLTRTGTRPAWRPRPGWPFWPRPRPDPRRPGRPRCRSRSRSRR